jgi:hypothetical protein
MNLFDLNEFEISAPQCSIHYSPVAHGDTMDIVVHQNIRVPDVIVSDILGPDHLPALFHILDHIKIMNILEKVILTILQKHSEGRGLFKASQFGFRAHHSMTLQSMRLNNHIASNFSNNKSTNKIKKQTNSVALVCKQAIPTERSPLVGKVGANFCG